MAFELPDIKKLTQDANDAASRLYQENRITEAEIILNQLMKVDDENIDCLELMGLVKHRQGKYDEAVTWFEKVLAKDDTRATTHNNLSLCYACLGEFDKSVPHAERAIEIDPTKSFFYVNLALQYKGQDQYEKAFALFDKSMELNSNDAGAWSNLGSTYGHDKRFEKAIECFDKAIALAPNLSSAYVDKGYALSLQGKFSEAWPFLHKRLEYFPPAEHFRRIFDFKKLWDGTQSLEGKRLVLWCEQGLGDMIQFSRYIKDLQDRGAYVIVHCPGPIVKVFQTNGWGNLVTEDAAKVEHDYHCSMIDVPMFLGLNDDQLGLRNYLKSSRQADLSQYDGMHKIGLVWAGNPRHPSDQKRSTKLSHFRGIHDIPNVKLFNLQKDLRMRAYANQSDPIDLTAGCEDMKIIDCSPFLEDFDDTAAILNELDLLISVDTSVLHIAASMGKPTWGLLHYNPDWRWCATGDKSVWYPSLRLFRQPERDNWDAVFDEVTKELKKFVESKQCCVENNCNAKGCCCG